MLGRLLRLADYEVAAFGCGEDFLSSLGARHPDCVILDVHMPVVTGFDVQSRMRAAGVHLPVIFITASDEPALEQAATAAGGVRLLRKPFSSEELLEAVGAALQQLPRLS